jgi:hypothetical protein
MAFLSVIFSSLCVLEHDQLSTLSFPKSFLNLSETTTTTTNSCSNSSGTGPPPDDAALLLARLTQTKGRSVPFDARLPSQEKPSGNCCATAQAVSRRHGRSGRGRPGIAGLRLIAPVLPTTVLALGVCLLIAFAAGWVRCWLLCCSGLWCSLR